ncbi:MAG: AAA family ATPase [Cognatishimia activa]
MTGFNLSQADKDAARALKADLDDWPEGVTPITGDVQPPKPNEQAATPTPPVSVPDATTTLRPPATPEAPENAPVSAPSPSEGSEAPKDANDPVSDTGEAPAGNSMPDLSSAMANALTGEQATGQANGELLGDILADRIEQSGLTLTDEMRSEIKAITKLAGMTDPASTQGVRSTPKGPLMAQDTRARMPHKTPSTRQSIYGSFCLRELCGLNAEPDIGKTTLIVGMLVSMTLGDNFMGYTNRSGRKERVGFLSFEDSGDEIQNKAVAAYKGRAIQELLKQAEREDREVSEDEKHNVRVDYGPLHDQFKILDASITSEDNENALNLFQMDKEQNRIIAGPDFNRLKEFILREKLTALAYDPSAGVAAGNYSENDNEPAYIEAAMMRRLARETKCALIPIAHTAKAGDSVTPRGAGARYAALRSSAYLRPMSAKEAGNLGIPKAEIGDYVVFEIKKRNILPPDVQQKRYYKFHTLYLDNDDKDFPRDSIGYLMEWKPKNVSDHLNLDQIKEICAILNRGINDGPKKPGEQPQDFYTLSKRGSKANPDDEGGPRYVVPAVRHLFDEGTPSAEIERVLKQLCRPHPYTGTQWLCEGKYKSPGEEKSRKPKSCIVGFSMIPEDEMTPAKSKDGEEYAVVTHSPTGDEITVKALGGFSPETIRNVFIGKDPYDYVPLPANEEQPEDE